MMRDYGSCIADGYNADQYADAWASDLYNQLYDSALETFWFNYGYENYKEDDVEELADYITISEAAYDKAYNMCYESYKEAFKRYEKEPADDFEEWEVDDAAREVTEILTEDLSNQVEEFKTYGEIRE